MNKNYEHLEIENKWYKTWEESNCFKPQEKGQPLCMVIPPPNVTGALHMGHALNNTLQDTVARFHRLLGRRVLWIPGTDHAGIATQNVVEKQLQKEGKTRDDLGREAFINRVWEWKKQYGNTITAQLRKLGASCDWSHERFTMDEGCSEAVKENFINLYNDKLIYRGEYIINWCPRCLTALSDIEVEHQDEEGALWYIKYPVVGGTKEDYIIVATTRPETMFGDTAVAVNPFDDRYKSLHGKMLELPLTNRQIPIITDELVDASFGTGAVKVTPAHDPNDFIMGKRHQLESPVIMDIKGVMNENVPEKYRGLDRYKCRELTISDLQGKHYLEKTEKHEHAVGHCYRCQTTIEPYLSKQWFVAMEKLAPQAIKEVEADNIKFIPDRWKKLYFDWMNNIRPWCISRQIWWGHRIPVWYCTSCEEVIASKTEIKSCTKCGSKNIKQDEDVLDTWFSSALWPFSTLGWPEKTEDLASFYPTDVLITGYDIITFWVSRMITMGLYNMKTIPFKDVYIHGLVRDAQGRKMSKSLGNVVDPLKLIAEKGADVLRLTLAGLVTSGGQDITLSDDKITASRNFINKLWNVSRFILMQEDNQEGNLAVNNIDKWIIIRLQDTLKQVKEHYQRYEFNMAIEKIYEFTWNEFCDWYVEMTKLHKDTSYKTLLYVLNCVVKMLHPVIPFITEELWQLIKTRVDFENNDNCTYLMVSTWPEPFNIEASNHVESMNLVQEIIKQVRNIKLEMKVPLDKKGSMVIIGNEKKLGEYVPYLKLLARLDKITFATEPPKEKSSFGIVEEVNFYLPLAELIDTEVEKNRLFKDLQRLEAEVASINARLGNDTFVSKAPAQVVEKERASLREKQMQTKIVKDKLENM